MSKTPAIRVRESFSVLGVDPGRKGALALVRFSLDGLTVAYARIDDLPREPALLCKAVAKFINAQRGNFDARECALEEPFGLQGQGNALSYGRAFGHLEAAIALALGDDLAVVRYHPSQWQPAVLPTRKAPGVDAKMCAAHAVRILFPHMENKLHEGVTDAVLIAIAHAIKTGRLSPVDFQFGELVAPPVVPKKKGFPCASKA